MEDTSLQGEIVFSCKDLFISFLLLELISQGLKDNSKPIVNKRVFSYCGEEEYGSIIACDNPSCALEWFHYNCVGITTNPVGNWYCENC
uniref:PHD-type domain-containing protein n=1 Tax=Amphimedon queenslandica TaxID=400682 RepID=A0A1X7UCN6_AMPQE